MFSFLLVILFPIVFFFIFLHSFAFGNSLSLSLSLEIKRKRCENEQEGEVREAFVCFSFLVDSSGKREKEGNNEGKKASLFPS